MELKRPFYSVAGDLFEYAESCFKTRGSGRSGHAKFKYTIDGTCKSGHNDTSLGNSIVNAAITVHAMLELGLTGDIIVAGDDLLAVLDRRPVSAEQIMDIERECGIVPEARMFVSPLDVSFISGTFFQRDNGAFVFTPKPGATITKLFWTVKPPGKRAHDDYIHAIVTGMRSLCGFVPVMDSFLAANDRQPHGVRAFVDKYWLRNVAQEAVCREEILSSFCVKYNVTTDEVVQLEEFFAGLQGCVGIVRHPVIDKLLAIDLAELADRYVAEPYRIIVDAVPAAIQTLHSKGAAVVKKAIDDSRANVQDIVVAGSSSLAWVSGHIGNTIGYIQSQSGQVTNLMREAANRATTLGTTVLHETGLVPDAMTECIRKLSSRWISATTTRKICTRLTSTS